MNVLRIAAIMRMAMFRFDGDHVELPMANPAFSHQALGEAHDRFSSSLEDDGLEAVFMVEMDVHRSHRQVVVIVLDRRQTFGQFPRVMVVYIGKVGYAMAGGCRPLPVALYRAANQVAHGFGTVAVAAGADQLVELPGQRFIKPSRAAKLS